MNARTNRTVEEQLGDAVSDAVLLDQFVERRDEHAFAAIVSRYSGLVLGVCRRVLTIVREICASFQCSRSRHNFGVVGKLQTLASSATTVKHRQVLRDEHSAEDAFQATILVLARRALMSATGFASVSRRVRDFGTGRASGTHSIK